MRSACRVWLRPGRRVLRGLLLLWIVAIVGCKAKKEATPPPSVGAASSLLISAKALKARLGEKILLLDVRPKKDFQAGCLLGATNLPTNSTFDTHTKSFKLAPLREMEELIGGAGVQLEVPVVVYGEGKMRDAARMFWILETHGHRKVMLLDGGVPAWKAEGGTLSPPTTTPPVTFHAKVQPRVLATKLAVRNAITNDRVIVIDCRPGDEYRGEKSLTSRRGRIPTAISVVWNQNLANFEDEEKPVVLKSNEELAALYPKGPAGTRYVVYCNKGKQSAVAYFSLRHLEREVAAYDGSWWEWSQDLSLPIEK